MPKNNILIVIDSLYYDKTILSSNHPSTMPFLDKLRSEGITCTNMFSEAPYTEAALVSLLCGVDTLKKVVIFVNYMEKKQLWRHLKITDMILFAIVFNH